MPSKKKKYNARFPAGRIKKIMQSDEEVGKVAQAVPVIISRTLEMFVGSLLQKAMQVTSAKNAKTLTPTHMKQCILSDPRFDFLKDLVKTVQDSAIGEDDVSAAALSQLAPNRALHQRRKSSCSSTKEETVIKRVATINEESIEECPQTSTNSSAINMNPQFYLETEADQRKLFSAMETDPLAETPANCSTIRFNPNFYSESMLEQRRLDTLVKAEPMSEQRAIDPLKAEPLPPLIKTEQFSTLIKVEPMSDQRRIDPLVKSEPMPPSTCSTNCFSPNFYSESGSEQRRMDPLMKKETITEPPSNCSTINFNRNFYSESISEPKRAFTIKNIETITEPTANCSTIHFNPNLYSESMSAQSKSYPVLKTENITESPANPSNLRFCPNFYSETVPEQSSTTGPLIKTETTTEHPQLMANCSTVHFGPNFYPRTYPEQKVSTHSLPVCPPPPVSYQKPTRIASFTMDEDYDT